MLSTIRCFFLLPSRVWTHIPAMEGARCRWLSTVTCIGFGDSKGFLGHRELFVLVREYVEVCQGTV